MESDLWHGEGFSHKFSVGTQECRISQGHQGVFELKINNMNFLYLLTLQKSKKEFKSQEDCVEDINVSKKLALNVDEKINLNISAIEGMKKKKGPGIQS